MGTEARRTYTEAQRKEALELYVELGPAETGRQMGIPNGTIRQWARRAGVTSRRAKNVQAAVEAGQLSLTQRKTQLAEDLITDVELLREQLFEPATVHHFNSDGAFNLGELSEPTFSDKVRILTAIGIAIDKSQLLSGEPTSRNENVTLDERRARVKAMRDDLAAKRAEKAA